MIKSLLALLLMLVLLVSLLPVFPAFAEETEDADRYVTLDGDWHFKLYRTYSQMYQYFPYAGGSEPFLQWEDTELAVLPDAGTFGAWETVPMPWPDYQTGGLLPQTRPGVTPPGEGEAFDPMAVMMPAWSEAWVARTFELPADFTDAETVTLLLGVVDDNDVVYINGRPVASSGFTDAEGKPVLNTLPLGGFAYSGEGEIVQWERSYWEAEREYTVPAEILKLGGVNEIALRVYNNNSYGGFYLGRSYALCGNPMAVRAVKGLPTKVMEDPAYDAVIAAQTAAIEAGDAEAFAATVWDSYHNDAEDKDGRVRRFSSLLEGCTDVKVSDEGCRFYEDDEGRIWYAGHRRITGRDAAGADTVLFDGEIEVRYAETEAGVLEVGNWNRCYTTSYSSGLLQREALYSVYLPPSYYTDPGKTYPAVYLLHGQNSSSASFLNVDHIGDFMDALIADGSVEEMIVLMPNSGKNAFYRDSEGDINDNTGPWRSHLTQEFIPMADAAYRTVPAADQRGISGISMGGYGAMTIGATEPELFSSVGVHMGWLPEDALEALRSLTPEQLAAYDFYLDVGQQDTTVGTEGTLNVHAYLESAGKPHGFSLREGGHNSGFYMAGMADSMKMHSDHFRGIHTGA